MKKQAVLVCNGNLDTKWLYSCISPGDFIVAVDGGANKLVKTKFAPDVIIGDMDSINNTALKKFRKCKLIRYPHEKDFLDLELALGYCIEKKFSKIIILGALGSRADMSLTNVFLLSQIPKGISARIMHENQEIYLVPSKKFSIGGVPGERISLFPIQGEVKGLSLEGFRYGLKNHDLRFGIGKGLSNEFKCKKARISFKDGMLLCVHFHKWF
ncbi:Thiamin pyrophosphokinase, catalytic domain [uncultured archaeon]|nr:Thiamin pyrophosphokinase, catalytic domain [uncultured archaeon]